MRAPRLRRTDSAAAKEVRDFFSSRVDLADDLVEDDGREDVEGGVDVAVSVSVSVSVYVCGLASTLFCCVWEREDTEMVLLCCV